MWGTVFRLSHLLMKWNFWFPPFTNLITSISTRTYYCTAHTVVGRVEYVELQYISCCCAVQPRPLPLPVAYCSNIYTAIPLPYSPCSSCLLSYCFEWADDTHTQYACAMSNAAIWKPLDGDLLLNIFFMVFKWHIQPLERRRKSEQRAER